MFSIIVVRLHDTFFHRCVCPSLMTIFSMNSLVFVKKPIKENGELPEPCPGVQREEVANMAVSTQSRVQMVPGKSCCAQDWGVSRKCLFLAQVQKRGGELELRGWWAVIWYPLPPQDTGGCLGKGLKHPMKVEHRFTTSNQVVPHRDAILGIYLHI